MRLLQSLLFTCPSAGESQLQQQGGHQPLQHLHMSPSLSWLQQQTSSRRGLPASRRHCEQSTRWGRCWGACARDALPYSACHLVNCVPA
jgi:hypothetical protein